MASFSTYLPLLKQAEGGYTDNPNDNGNWTGGKKGVGQLVGTNKGVSAPVYARFLGRIPSRSDMLNITQSVANSIFKRWYWDAVNADSINSQSVANIIVDHAVNAGNGAAGRLVQRVLNERFGKNLQVDGAIGPNTITAINSVDSFQLHEAIKKARADFYKNLNQPVFINGWLNRLTGFVYEKKEVAGAGLLGVLAIGAFLWYKNKN